jgi:cation:H+ antiporter
MLTHLLLFAGGLALLIAGADRFLTGASAIALRFGVSPFVVGLVIVGFGTSAPELAVNLSAVSKGNLDIALGNVVGSNIANVGLILGLSALLAPLLVDMRLLRVEGPLMLAVSLLLLLLCLDGALGRADGVLLLVGFAGLLWLVARSARDEPKAVQDELGELATPSASPWSSTGWLLLGLAGLIYGATLMVDAAVAMARWWGWSELLIGLTVVAVGTSLPELASSVLAARRGQTDIAVGNVVGSNLFNILLILGMSAAWQPLPVAAGMIRLEIPAMIGFAVLSYLLMHRYRRLSRLSGALLLLAFASFTAWQALAAAV